MTVLITGNMGYVGPVVVDRLRREHPEWTLLGYDIGYYGACITGGRVLPECRVDVQHFGDVRAFHASILKGVDAVVHLAAISNDPIGNRFEEVTLDINHRASVALAVSAKEAGVRSFVFASSCSMYGSADDAPRSEEAPLNPLTAYARSKVLTERDLQPLASRDFKVSCLRFSTACGWSDRLRLDLVLNDFVAGAVSAGRIGILSDGSPWRPLIDVKDMARAIDWAIVERRDEPRPFLAVNVGSPDGNYQVKDLAQAVSAAIPNVTVDINRDAPPDKRSYKVSFDLFGRLAPRHQPKVDLATSIRELRDGLHSIGFADTAFRDSRLMRLRVITELQEAGLLGRELRWTDSAGTRRASPPI